MICGGQGCQVYTDAVGMLDISAAWNMGMLYDTVSPLVFGGNYVADIHEFMADGRRIGGTVFDLVYFESVK